MKHKVRDINFGPEVYVMAVVAAAFFFLKIWWLAPRFSDGYLYMYLGQQVMDGLLLYKDAFYASPPLLIYISGIIGLVGGFSWQVFAIVPLLLSLFDGLLIYWIVRRKTSDWSGVLAASLYLLSYVVLATTDFVTGIHYVTTLSLLGLFFLEKKKWVMAGVMFAMAILIKVYAIVLFAPLLLAVIWKREWRGAFKVGLSYLITIGLVIGGYWLLVGETLWQHVIFNNLGRGVGIPRWRILEYFAWHDWWVVIGLGVVYFWRRRMSSLWALPVLGLLFFFLIYPDIYYLYLKMLVAWLVMWVGWFHWRVFKGRNVVETVVVVLLLVSVAGGLSMYRYVEEQSDAAVIIGLDEIVEYLESITEAGEGVYGSYELVPLLALDADRPVFGQLVDTNSKFFDKGVFDLEERSELLKEGAGVVITRGLVNERGSLTAVDGVVTMEFLQRDCRLGRVFPIARDFTYNAIVVWRCGN